MDIKNPYIGDRSDRKEKVVIALNGGLDSAVAAYLLKIQKYDLIGVTISNSWEASPQSQSEVFSCHIDSEAIKKIKDFCHSISIPHVVISNTDVFYDQVVDRWFASKLCGIKSDACSNCHQLRMKLLYEKMKELGAKFLATGHYAKVFGHEGHNSVFVHTSNEDSDDQSAELSKLPHEILKSLLLPLSDLQKKEVIKLGENFGLVDREKQVLSQNCLSNTKVTIDFLSNNIPEKFKQGGAIISASDPAHVSEHLGIAHYNVGEEVSFVKSGPRLFLKRYNPSNQVMEAAPLEAFNHSEVHLVDCHFAEDTFWEGPMSGVIKLSNQEMVDCWIYPKSLNSVHLVWDGKRRVLERDIVAVYKKRGRNSKLYFTGSVRYIARSVEGEEIEKVDYTSDI